MSGENPPRDQEVAARTARVAAEMLQQGGAALGDLKGLNPEQIIERLQDGSSAIAEAEQTVAEHDSQRDGN
jgi:predicted metal-dependent hydrolase